MTLQSWKNKGQYFDYKSHQIFTLDEGQGENLLLIHGFPTASWDWWQMWDELTTRFRVVALDMLGFGFSDKPQKYPYSMVDQANLIEQFLTSKQIKNIKIISHDYGDSVAQELIARHNEGKSQFKIESVCFLNGGIFPDTHKPLLIQKILMSPIGGFVGRRFTRDKMAKNFKKIFGPNTQPSEHELDQFWELISNNEGRKIVHLLIRYMQERKVNEKRWVNAILDTDIPLRLINGVVDPISGQHVADKYKSEVPNADVIELENIGHFPLVEAPDLVLKHYFDFVEKYPNA